MRRYHPQGLQAIEPQALFGLFVDSGPSENKGDALATVITIRGPLVQHGEWWCDSYESIRQRVSEACDQVAPYVVLRVDSPGGEVAGCFDAARAIRAMCDRAEKQLVVHVEGQCSSAAYALSCVADRIVASRTASVGSIGVIAVRYDDTVANERTGHRVTLITSGSRKADGDPNTPLEAEELEVHQAEVDELADEFFQLVAHHRSISAEGVKALEAASFRGGAAVKAGLIDEIGSFDHLVASLGAGGKETMSKEEEAQEALRSIAEDEDENEEARARARRALAAMDEEDDDEAEDNDEDEAEEEEEDKAEDDEEEEDKAAQAVSAATAGEIVAHNIALERRIAALERQAENDERNAVIAKHGGVTPGLAKILKKKPLAEVKALLAELPKPRKPQLGDAAATATVSGTRGENQDNGPRLPPAQAKSMRLAMGLETLGHEVRTEGNTLYLGAPQREGN